MKVTEATIRGIYATAATYLPADDTQAAPRHLFRALDDAIHRRYEGEPLSPLELRTLREASAERLGWTSAWTLRTLAAELRDLSLEGLDLAELVGLRHANAAGRVWVHGAWSPRRVVLGRPRPDVNGRSHSGRPWVHLWVDGSWHRNPVVIHAATNPDDVRSERPDVVRAGQVVLVW
ncbi:hypothetical protein OOK58_42265 [Streptomyces sp. NBC_01728]|uniref:hypothetical protein n=1 Tax=unclassified Streptomyces TaxID=2593676 RepID=UPI002250088D|nr:MULTISPECIES: hypothetical protein [unclassified Streptomyces]MCX4458541.1 hypothetical protein [Streptomyces sp. NBC_01719]MCX4497898.1 hypothetical protein [Streptomyces sp. NBC_01728]